MPWAHLSLCPMAEPRSSGANPEASTLWWKTDRHPAALSRMLVAKSSVTEMVAIGITGWASCHTSRSMDCSSPRTLPRAPKGDHSRLARTRTVSESIWIGSNG